MCEPLHDPEYKPPDNHHAVTTAELLDELNFHPNWK